MLPRQRRERPWVRNKDLDTASLVRISVITPSFRSGQWLRLCIASVADQGVEIEHIVQDAGSDDGTLDWLLTDSRVRAFVEKDAGMYDAINRGLRRASGDLCAYLNCDEQYLPGALPAVADFFERHPNVEVLFADFVVVDTAGQYVCHRKVQVPGRYHLWVSHLPTFSCAMFFRRRLVQDETLLFNPRLRDVGDGDWVLRLLQRGTRMAVLRQFTSVFTLSGANMMAGENARREARALHATAPGWVRACKPAIILQYRIRRAVAGMYRQPPFSFAAYTRESPAQRVTRYVVRPVGRWRGLS